ncbi:MAG TPA: calcium/proton exchanger [Thermoplasmata archaeon]|nr:calcium/proton exchanger [Thermoplasmata archaeon]
MADAARWKFLIFPAVLVPIPILLRLLAAPDLAVFATAGVAVIPLAHLMGVSTEELSKRAGPGIGGLLNATMGNATELIIALIALARAAALADAGNQAAADGLVEVVKASISGSIIANLLLVLGLSMLVGGLRHKRQKFVVHGAELQVTMLVLAIAALVMPELFQLSYAGAGGVPALPNVSLWIAVLLLVGYFLGLVFSLHTHKDVFNPLTEEAEKPLWSRNMAIGILVGSTVLVGLVAETLVGSVEAVTASLGLTEIFMGVIIIAIIGNAAEHGAAITMAWKNKMDLSVGIATISSAQVALFVTPVLVLASVAFGEPLTLAFEIFELVAIILSVAIVSVIAKDGETNWYEGALLLLVYAIIGVGFFFHP